MDVQTYVREQISGASSFVEAALQGITDEQLNWPPPGTIHPIGTILVHMVAAEDYFVQAAIQGRQTLWEDQYWGQKIGVEAPPAQGNAWDEFRSVRFCVAPPLAYRDAVRLATETYLAGLTEQELDRRVAFGRGESSVADVLMLLVIHSVGHAGEIAAVKGMQGLQGLPF